MTYEKGAAYLAGQKAYQNQQSFPLEQQDREIKNQSNQLALAQQKLVAVNDLLTGVTPENYSTRRQIAINSGISKPDLIPEQYDPN